MKELYRRWFPRSPDRGEWAPKLAAFYANNAAYHEMTRSGGKADHPQVRLLSCLIKPGETYAEIGCGGGAVCRMVGETAFVHGFDVSPLALEHAKTLCADRTVRLARCSADALPLPGNAVAGSYSFELLEHVWDPVAVAREMVRITKPGGFILISTPSRFSLDLHLRKHAGAGAVDLLLAGIHFLGDAVTGRPYRNLIPDIGGEVFPDCDMVSSIVPMNFAKELERMGCGVEFCDTTYMGAHRQGSATTLDYQRNAARPFFRCFGDHVLILAHKS